MKAVVIGALLLLVGLYLSDSRGHHGAKPKRDRETDPVVVDGESHTTWTNGRGESMFVREWKASPNPIGLVFLFHGMGSHSGEASIRETANLFVSKNYHVIALDQAGHGRTVPVEDNGWVSSYKIWIDDGLGFINEITSQKQYQEKPFFLAGHSLGGAISLELSLAMQENPSKFWAGTILIAPAIHQSLEPSWIEMQALELILKLGGTKLPFGPSPHPANFPDFESFERYETDPWTYSDGVKLGFGWTCLEFLEQLVPKLSSAKFPFLVLHCSNDPVIPLSGSKQLFETAQSTSKELKVYDNCFHVPLTSGQKEKSASDMLGWMEKRLGEIQP
eukprot:TRINITY_DN2837_c0_g1_i1.p1 TRINITY_DN2837_c0_g1~~TRINITY_DN2837_c0_g1_i1.p1  ORF type:complete len:333 (-),score=57.37 TRINITY_DN2837_c0_g1_i1:39-1037(-)